MMNDVAIINTCDWGSTGKIAKGLQAYLKSKGKKVLFCYGRGEKRNDSEWYRFCSPVEIGFHYFDYRLTGRLNGASKTATKRLIARLRQIGIKEIYLVNLHGYILNEKLFLNYLVKDNIRVVYIMADESAFLGNCTYRSGCEDYKNNCKNCRKIKGLAKILFSNNSEKAYRVKWDAYRKINQITFLGPEFVIMAAKTSPLLEGKRLEIVDEAIDISVNTPKETTSLRKELGIKNDQIVIGCVAPFSYPRKGVRFLVEAARILENDTRFVFVHVGYDVKDKTNLPQNYIPIGYVKDQEVLTRYYSLSDLFVFPSIQDTMPNACLEALACGTPLLCFNISGMPYMADETVMTLVESENVEQMVEVIKRTNRKTQDTIKTCRNYALTRFDNQKYYVKLESIMNSM